MKGAWGDDETRVFVENFENFHEASLWLERHLYEVPFLWKIFNAGVNYMEIEDDVWEWRASIAYGLTKEKDDG